MPGPTRTYTTNADRQRAYRERQRTAIATQWTPTGGFPVLQVPSAPSRRRWRAMVKQAQILLQVAAVEMEAYYEQRTEAWREGEQGEAFLEHLETIQEAQQVVEELNRSP